MKHDKIMMKLDKSQINQIEEEYFKEVSIIEVMDIIKISFLCQLTLRSKKTFSNYHTGRRNIYGIKDNTKKKFITAIIITINKLEKILEILVDNDKKKDKMH